MAVKKITEGGHLMLFIKDTDNKYKSIGYATNHSMSITSETDEISTKDHGAFASKSVKKLSYQFNASHLYSDDFDKLFNLMSTKQELSIVWGLKKEDDSKLVSEDNDLEYWSSATQNYKCRGIISSLSVNAPSGARATFDITIDGIGEMKRVTNVAQ